MAEIGNDLTSLFNQLNPYGSGGSGIDTTYGNAGIGQGIGSSPDVTAQSGGSSGGQMSPSPGAASAQGASSQDLSDYFAEVSGYNRWALKQQLAEKKKELDFSYKQLAAQTKNAQQRLNLDKWYQRAQIDLLQQTHDLDVKKQQDVEQQFAQTFGLEKEKFAAQQAQFGQQQGLDLLRLQASLSGPQNFVQSSNLAAGVAGNPTYAAFVNSLVNGQNGRLFGPGAGVPQAQSLGGLAGLMGGQSSGGETTTADQMAGGTDLQTRLAQAQSLTSGAGQLIQAGGGALGAQQLERLSPTDLSLLSSGFGGAGGDFSEYLRQYKNSRVGQAGNALAA